MEDFVWAIAFCQSVQRTHSDGWCSSNWSEEDHANIAERVADATVDLFRKTKKANRPPEDGDGS